MALNFPNNPTVGQVFQDYVWNGTAWAGIGSANNLGVQVAALQTFDANVVGLKTVVPTSIVPVGSGSAASVNSAGLVTFSTCTSIELAGVFSSRFRNYKIVIDGFNFSGSSTSTFTFARIGNGTTFAASSYQGGFNGVEAGYTAATNVPDTSSVPLTYVNTSQAFGTELNVYSPFESTVTKFYAASIGYAPGNARYIAHAANAHSSNTSFSAINFSVTSGNMTGSIQVFGFDN